MNSKNMNGRETLGITIKKEDSLGDWFSEVIVKAGFADYSPVKGCIYYYPPAIYAWERIREFANKLFQEIGIEDVYLPLFIPEEMFEKESEHVHGFSPEVAWVETDSGRWAVRPTSEVLFSDVFARKVRSYRDLPIKYNQWCSVVRMETKSVRPFLRGREFLWQETHAVYSCEEDALKDVIYVLNNIYKRISEELLLIPVLAGRKSEKEKFAGARKSFGIEGIMPDGKALQLGTTHYLGQGFARVFDISFLDEKNQKKYVHQASWGISTRMIGAAIMVHSDNKGIVLNPELIKNKIVVVPIVFKESEESKIYAKKIVEKLKLFNPILDDRDYTPGWKFNEWELKGIPLRLEIGPRDVEKRQVIAVLRHNNQRISIGWDELTEEKINQIFEDVKKDLYQNAKKLFDSYLDSAKDLREFEKKLEMGKIIKVNFCDNPECEEKVKEKYGVTSRVIVEEKKGKCIFCDHDSNYVAYFGKSY
ncbi:MAG: proline--tRNA ligase [Candidatus Woesearchaeota archaeon]